MILDYLFPLLLQSSESTRSRIGSCICEIAAENNIELKIEKVGIFELYFIRNRELCTGNDSGNLIV